MRIVLSENNEPHFNLAAEEYLFASNRDDECLYVYVNKPCVIVGSNQAVINEVDLEFCERKKIPVIRRISGGGAVFHDLGNINFCFIKNRTSEPLSGNFLLPLVNVLNEGGFPVSVGKRKDLWVKNKKVSGSASHISKGRELHHCTLLYDSNLEMLERALNPVNRFGVAKATQSVVSPVSNLREYNGGKESISVDGFLRTVVNGLLDYYRLEEEEYLLADDCREITSEYMLRYLDREWNYRK
ncbi:MAG: lipoate--protein ligase family protein [Fermentimonas sp.]|jgi:lipoate-protein ligase A